MSWIASAPFEAMVTLDSGGADLVTIPAGAVLENVILPPEPTWRDDNAGFRPVDFDYNGVAHTATIFDFLETGGCHAG
ncbi:MAG: hypothetical protein JWP63_2550 [Candidatus Solibacter sp.]|nr:hypothetical protein [Candidatus Solibacter sp.]